MNGYYACFFVRRCRRRAVWLAWIMLASLLILVLRDALHLLLTA